VWVGISYAASVASTSVLIVVSGSSLGWYVVLYVVSLCHMPLSQSRSLVPILVSGWWALCGVWRGLWYLLGVRHGEREACGSFRKSG
jgi:hypothetical protein